jgi:hypothetical protein
MTYRPDDDTGSATGRRKTEIEITPEMIEAAARALALFDTEFSTLEDGAESLLRTALETGGYSVMESARRA